MRALDANVVARFYIDDAHDAHDADDAQAAIGRRLANRAKRLALTPLVELLA